MPIQVMLCLQCQVGILPRRGSSECQAGCSHLPNCLSGPFTQQLLCRRLDPLVLSVWLRCGRKQGSRESPVLGYSQNGFPIFRLNQKEVASKEMTILENPKLDSWARGPAARRVCVATPSEMRGIPEPHQSILWWEFPLHMEIYVQNGLRVFVSPVFLFSKNPSSALAKQA